MLPPTCAGVHQIEHQGGLGSCKQDLNKHACSRAIYQETVPGKSAVLLQARPENVDLFQPCNDSTMGQEMPLAQGTISLSCPPRGHNPTAGALPAPPQARRLTWPAGNLTLPYPLTGNTQNHGLATRVHWNFVYQQFFWHIVFL